MLQQDLKHDRRPVRRDAHAASSSSTSRRRAAGRADPARARRRSAPVRRRRARRRRRRRAARREAGRSRRRISRSSACTSSTSAIHDAVRAIAPSARGELEITDAIQWLIDQGHRVAHEILEGWWIDTGKKDPLLALQPPRARHDRAAHRRRRRRRVARRGPRRDRSRRAARATRSCAGPRSSAPARVLVDTYVGPYTSIGADCELRDAEIEHSVVLERSRIIGVHHIHDSLLGREVEVVRSGERPKATRLDARRPFPRRPGVADGDHRREQAHRGRLPRRARRAPRRARAASSRRTGASGFPSGREMIQAQPRRPRRGLRSSACTTTCTRPTTGTCRSAGRASCCTTCASAARPTARPRCSTSARPTASTTTRRVHPARRRARVRVAHRHDDHVSRRRLLQRGRRARRRVGRSRDRGRLGRRRTRCCRDRDAANPKRAEIPERVRPVWPLRT